MTRFFFSRIIPVLKFFYMQLEQEILSAINEFAEDTKKRFEDVDKRFDAVDKRFDAVEAKIEDLTAEVQGVRAELERLRNDLEKLTKTTQEDTNALAHNFIDLEKRIKRIEEHLRLQPAN